MCEALFSWEVCSWIKKLTPGGSTGKESTCNAGDKGDVVQSLSPEDPLGEEQLPTPVFLPGEFQGQRDLVGYSPWGCKESDTMEHVHTHTHTHTHTQRS